MFELMAHAAHMKAHFTSLVPEESRHEYVQEHKMGFCTQFKHCETNPFYPDVVQALGTVMGGQHIQANVHSGRS